MEGPRAPREAELPRITQFLNENLRPDTDWSITHEYPIAFSASNKENMRVIAENERILSHAVIKYLFIKTPLGLFKIAAIGSVVTDKQHRNKGLSKKIVEECVAAAQEQGCDFAVLWTNLFDHYRKLDFELAGSEVAMVLEKEIEPPAQDLKFVCSNKIDPEALLKVYSRHTVASVRKVDQIREFLKIPNSRVYTAWDANNQLQAYAVEGRGADLGGYIHEWGGGVSKLLPLLAHIRREHGRPITVIAPEHSQNLIRTMKQYPVTFNHGFLGMIRILQTNNLFYKIKRGARARGHSELILEEDNGVYLFGHQDNLFQTEHTKDLVRLIFGPQKASEIYPFDGRSREILEAVLPVPMWIWGWDSV